MCRNCCFNSVLVIVTKILLSVSTNNQAGRQDLAAGGAKNQKEGPKTRRGGHILEIQYGMYAATGEPNVKWGTPISNGGPGTSGLTLATALPTTM